MNYDLLAQDHKAHTLLRFELLISKALPQTLTRHRHDLRY